MSNLFIELDHRTLLLIQFVGLEAQALGAKAYLVGGTVRDLMLKRHNVDLDITVEGNGIELAQAVAGKKNAKIVCYPAFKTATVTFSNGIVIDFATARSEVYKTSGALPIVSEGSISDDLFRRDFTINAMAVAINPQELGRLVDFFDGLKDLKAKKIRVLHKESFLDDATRILRAVRFSKRLKFAIGPSTLRLIKSAISEGAIGRIKPPRWFEEFRKILNEDNVPLSIQQLAKLGAMTFIRKPFTYDLKILTRIQKAFPYARRHWLTGGDLDRGLVYLMALVISVEDKKLKALLQSWNLTREEIKKVLLLLERKKIIKNLSLKKISNSEIFRRLEGLSSEALLLLYCLSTSIQSQRNIKLYQEKLSAMKLEINGDDVKNLGVGEGREIKRTLDQVLNRKLDGKISNREEEIQFAQSLIKQPMR